MEGVTEDIKEEFSEWLSDRPSIIKELGGKCPPWNRYRIKQMGQHCSVHAYTEEGTITVIVDGHDSKTLNHLNELCPTMVYGVSPDDLEAIDGELGIGYGRCD